MRQWLVWGCIVLFPLLAVAQQYLPAQTDKLSPRYLAQIEVHSTDELNHLLQRAELLFDAGKIRPGSDTPIAFILHGGEARSLINTNYRANKPLVDLAARLSAFEVVDIKVCETWLGGAGLDQSQLPPFIGTVPFGPAEQQRLLEQQDYVNF